MSREKPNLDELVEVFEKTFEDKSFSRSEKKAVSQLLEQDYSLKKNHRDILRGKIFALARRGLETQFSSREAIRVLDWLETANKLLLNRRDSAVYFSPGEKCRQVIVEQLNNALSSVDICVYTISDDFISDEILKCRDRKVNIRIISDDDKVDDLGSDVYAMAAAGIETRIDNSRHHMHHKFAVFDNKRVLTGSYNWTRSAAKHNQENILLTDDKQTVAAYSEEFNKLWTKFNPL
ncbi:MAG: DUF1669 domain-containing protein [bacterium]|nr:DUF1669 domain-containing protein [bacterium]